MSQTLGLAPDVATFRRLANSRFSLRLDSETSAALELVEIREGASTASFEQFSLTFRAPVNAPAEQRIYELAHEATGAFELFLVPIGRTEDGLLYEAVFSQRVEPAAGGV